MKKIYIKTLGCEKNTVDSECMMKLFENKGCKMTDDPDKADYLIVNTCGFILDAKTQSIESILELGNEKKENQKLVVTGCLSQRYVKELEVSMPEVDFFFGVNDYDKITNILDDGYNRITNNYCSSVFTELPRKAVGGSVACIKISEGCNNICSYCAIPRIRGKYRSRKEEDILTEATMLAEGGVKELVVIGQDVTYYGRDFDKPDDLPRLLKKLCKIEGIHWIRLMYCYEDEITPELIETIKTEPKIVKYIDIPIQHCSTKILKAMNRKSTYTSINRTIRTLRKEISGIVIRTTLITGFPGETKEDFEKLYSFVEKTKFDRLGVFAYSKEEGTKAALMKNQVRQSVKESRRDSIMQLQREISLKKNIKRIGQTIEVIVEEPDTVEKGNYTYIARASFDAEGIDNGVVLHSNKKLKTGEFINCVVTDAFDYDLCAEAINEFTK